MTVTSNASASIANGNGQGGEGDEQNAEAGFGIAIDSNFGSIITPDDFSSNGPVFIAQLLSANGADGSGYDGGTGGFGGTGSVGFATETAQEGSDGDANLDFIPFNDKLIKNDDKSNIGADSTATLIISTMSDREGNGGNITMVGGIDLDSTAAVTVGDLVSEDPESIAHNSAGAYAESAVILLAANEIFGHEENIGVGNIDIQGDLTSNATADLSVGDNIDNSGQVGAFALLVADAANDVLLTPTAGNVQVGNLFGAEAVATSSGNEALAISVAIVQAGERTPPGSEGFHDVETTESDGNVSIKGDVYSYATTQANGDEKTKERAGAVLDITAHGDSPDGGNVTNEYYTHGLEAIARTGIEGTESFSEAFTNATQGKINLAIAGDRDLSPTTFREYSLGGQRSMTR